MTYIYFNLNDISEMIRQRQKNRKDATICIVGFKGQGKCQVKGDKVLLSDGSWKNIEDIKIGDRVLSPNLSGVSTFSNVIGIHNHYDEDVYEVRELTRDKKLLYTCSGKHLIPIIKSSYPRNSDKSRRYIKKAFNYSAEHLFKLKSNYCSQICSYTSPLVEFENFNTPDIEPYSLGVFLGDGSFTDSLNITTKDIEIIDEVCKYYQVMKIYDKPNNLAKMYRFGLKGNFSKQLTSLGLRYKRSGDKFIPKECLISSKDYRLKILAGLIDTDGYIGKDNSIRICTKSKILADDIFNLVSSLGGYSNIRKIKKTIKSINFSGEYYNVLCSFKNASIIPLKTLKKNRIRNRIIEPRNIAITVKKTAPQIVYGIELDSDDKLYITNNWFVTHNSTCGYKLATKLKKIEIRQGDNIFFTKKFKPERDMFYSREDVLNFITKRKFSVGLVDELINVGYNREFSSSDQQAIIKALNQFRSPHFNCFIACNPFFYDLDPDFRNLFWMRLDVVRRGVALVHTVNESIYGNDPWDTNYNKKIEEKWRKRDGTVKPKYHQLTTFRGILLFTPLSKKQEIRYESVRNYKRGLANKNLSNQVSEKTMTVYDNLVKLALDRKLTEELLRNICVVNNLVYLQARSHINRKLREIDKNKTLKHLIVKEDKKEDLDELGYPIAK